MAIPGTGRAFFLAAMLLGAGALVPATTSAQDPPPDLLAAIEAYVQDRGETYAGACEDTTVEEHTGQWCHSFRELSATQAQVALGPTFSEFAVVVVFTRGWQATSEEPINSQDPPSDAVCADGDFSESGTLLSHTAQDSEADEVAHLRWASHEGCERFVIDLGTGEGEAAQVPPTVEADFLRDLGLVRVRFPEFGRALLEDASDIHPRAELVHSAYTVYALDGYMFVDIHLTNPAIASATVLEDPARVVVDLQPGGAELPAGGLREGDVVLLQPRPDSGELTYPLEITGYSRTFESNVIARMREGGEIVVEDFTTAAAWAETWGEYAMTIPDGPTGDVELFVGELSARDGSEQGLRLDVNISGGGGGGGETYTVQPGDTLFSLAQRFGVTVEELAEANNIDNPDEIFAGQELTIPS